jgi:hypothetical protein
MRFLFKAPPSDVENTEPSAYFDRMVYTDQLDYVFRALSYTNTYMSTITILTLQGKI